MWQQLISGFLGFEMYLTQVQCKFAIQSKRCISQKEGTTNCAWVVFPASIFFLHEQDKYFLKTAIPISCLQILSNFHGTFTYLPDLEK